MDASAPARFERVIQMARTFSKAMFALTAVAVLALGSCVSAAGDIAVFWSSPIAAGSTYAWNPANAPKVLTIPRRVDNDVIREGIMTAVDANLGAKGFRLVEPSQAQYLVAYDVRVQTPTDYDSWLVRDIDYVKGTMILDITDRSSGQVVWRAMSQRPVYRHDPTQETFNAIFADMAKTVQGVSSSGARVAPPR
jgi:hypothetical protein